MEIAKFRMEIAKIHTDLSAPRHHFPHIRLTRAPSPSSFLLLSLLDTSSTPFTRLYTAFGNRTPPLQITHRLRYTDAPCSRHKIWLAAGTTPSAPVASLCTTPAMSSRSASDSPNGAASARKRHRSSRIKACDRCMRGKLRCGDIQAEGCARCRARRDGAPCSLAGLVSAPPAPDAMLQPAYIVPPDDKQARAQMEQQEELNRELAGRVAWLEAQLAQATTSSLGGSSTLVASRAGSIVHHNSEQPSLRSPELDSARSGRRDLPARTEWRCSWYDLTENCAAICPEFGAARFEFTPVMPKRSSAVELGLATETECEVAFLR